MTKEAALDISKQLYIDTMVNNVEVKGKKIKIDHHRVKALKEFENTFRWSFDMNRTLQNMANIWSRLITEYKVFGINYTSF